MAEEQTEPQVDISEPEKPSDESLKEGNSALYFIKKHKYYQ